MRILDIANSWSANTYRTYSPKLTLIRKFELAHPGLRILAVPTLLKPPRTAAIALAWVESGYSTQSSPIPHRHNMAFGTIRQLRSAAGWHHTLALLVGTAEGLVYDEKQKKTLFQGTVINHEASLTRFSKGLKERIGDTPEPSWALLDRHIRAFDCFFDNNYHRSTSPTSRRRWAQAGLANILLWLGWLRAQELFSLRWMDVIRIRPSDGPVHDLPFNMGCLLLRLLEATKTNRATTADVPIAYATKSGYKAGRWYERLHSVRHTNVNTLDDPAFIFVHETGTPWDSFFYRQEFVYPLLYKLQIDGDPYLSPFKGGTGQSIQEAFKSLHMYRRGGRSHCDIVRPPANHRRKATPAEVYEHGRWRRARSSEAIDVVYRSWTLFDRLQLTLCCM